MIRTPARALLLATAWLAANSCQPGPGGEPVGSGAAAARPTPTSTPRPSAMPSAMPSEMPSAMPSAMRDHTEPTPSRPAPAATDRLQTATFALG